MKKYKPPFDIETISIEGKPITINCDQGLRTIPDRRVACIGRYQGKPAFVKIFFHKLKAQRHWERESLGIQILMENNIPVPNLLFAGKEKDGPGYIMVQELIPDPVNLKALLKENRKDSIDYINKIIALIVKMHKTGLIQQDMHSDNFLLSGGDVYCIDAAMITKSGTKLTATESYKNVAQFTAQFPPSGEKFENEIWRQYCLQEDNDWYDYYLSDYKDEVNRTRRTLAENLLAKLYRESSAYMFHKNFKKRFCIKKSWHEQDKKGKLNNLEKLFVGKNIEYLKKGGSSTVIKTGFNDRELVIKRYNLKNFLHAMKRALRRTRAARSWSMSHLLQVYGIETPEPVAFFENRIGPIRRTSYFICEYIPGPNLLDYFTGVDKLSAEQKQVADQVISLLDKMGKAGIYHGDMKATNLVISDGKIYLLDLDAVSWYQGTTRARAHHKKDLNRFLRNWKPESEIYKYFSNALNP